MAVDYTARLVGGYILPYDRYEIAVKDAVAADFFPEVIEGHLEKLDEYSETSDYILSSHWYAIAGPGEANRISEIPEVEYRRPSEMVRRMAIAMGIELSYGIYLVLRAW